MNGNCYVGCDQHKRYSIFRSMDEKGRISKAERIEHNREEVKKYLEKYPVGTPIAVETTGSWYWMIDEMEKHGLEPKLTRSRKAKLMMGEVNKTDKLDAKGLAMLLRNGTLPTVWIPEGELRDQREVLRFRMSLQRMRTGIKNRIHSILSKYAIKLEEVSDIFGIKGRELVYERIKDLPEESLQVVKQHFELLDEIYGQMDRIEKRMSQMLEDSQQMKLLRTIPGVGFILSAVMTLEIGDIKRFANHKRLASYAGTVPRVKSSGGKTYYGRVRQDVNRYLKWAFVEAANCIVKQHNKEAWSNRHVIQLYKRLKKNKGHAKAVVAVARHLSEAAYWILNREEEYKEPKNNDKVSSTRR